MLADARPRPAAALRLIDAIAIVVAVEVGVGIFRAPSIVASGVSSEAGFVGLWLLGGALSLVGALCYAELVTAFPSRGGEYHILQRAFGQSVAFLFAWARLTVIGTGSLALLAFVAGDYLAQLAPLTPLGAHASALYGGALVVVLVGLNILGLRVGTAVQRVVMALLVIGLVAIGVAGLAAPPAATAAAPPPTGSLGFAMVFVLLTYGGWNEAAYLSAEVRGGPRRIVLALLGGVGVVTALYVVINLAYVRVLGVAGVRAADAVALALAHRLAGDAAVAVVSVLVVLAVVTSVNATILTVSRTAYALARDITILRPLARWDDRASAPVPALLALGGFALVLIGLGALARGGFQTMVELTAPAFWGFMLLVGVALFVLRLKEPDVARPFRVPLYPLLPVAFCAICVWLLRASLEHARLGAIAGVAVVALGAVPLLISKAKESGNETNRDDDLHRGRPDVGV